MAAERETRWPALPVADWQDTRDTLQLWAQVVGKTKLALAPPLNHWWGITFHLGATGLTTGLMPTEAGGLEVESLAGVIRGSVIRAAGGSVLARSETLGHPVGGVAPVGEEFLQLIAGDVAHVERGEVQAVLRRRNDAGLVGTVKRVRGRYRVARGCRARDGLADGNCGAGTNTTGSRQPK